MAAQADAGGDAARHAHGGEQAQGRPSAEHVEEAKVLDTIADVVLHYRPKAKSKPGRKRQRAKRKLEKARG